MPARQQPAATQSSQNRFRPSRLTSSEGAGLVVVERRRAAVESGFQKLRGVVGASCAVLLLQALRKVVRHNHSLKARRP